MTTAPGEPLSMSEVLVDAIAARLEGALDHVARPQLAESLPKIALMADEVAALAKAGEILMKLALRTDTDAP